jgi:hypothetical protein
MTLVEVVATKRPGMINAVDTLIEDGIETQRRWRVHFTDSREPIMHNGIFPFATFIRRK